MAPLAENRHDRAGDRPHGAARRGEDGAMTTEAVLKPFPGRAALKRGDLADAKRRRPESDLSAYAAARGLSAIGDASVPALATAMPNRPDRQFNVLHGPLAPGRDGVLFHHLYGWPVDVHGDARNATFYGSVWNPSIPKGWWKPDLGWVPYLGEFSTTKERDDIEYAVGVPCTTVAVALPEASGAPDRVAERSNGDTPLHAARSSVLQAFGGRPFCRVQLASGVLSVTVDGFIDDPAELDRLRTAVATAVAGLAAQAGTLAAALTPPPAEVKSLFSLDFGARRRRKGQAG